MRIASVPSPAVERPDESGQRSAVLALLAVVVVLDQATKWWAWRQVSGAKINSGGTWLAGPQIGQWYAGPVTGALLDLLGFSLLSVAVLALLRRPRPGAVLVSAALMAGGWISNLLDRLGMHHWTAPGSIRGAVDFIHIGQHKYNVADFFIIGATPLVLLALACVGWQALNGPGTAGPFTQARGNHRQPRAVVSALAGLVCVVVLAVSAGAASYGGVTTPIESSSASAYPSARP